MSKITRRKFMKQTLVTAGAGLALQRSVWSQARGANDQIRVAVCGLHGQGNGHLKRYLGMSGVKVVALCDPDQSVLDQRIKEQTNPGSDRSLPSDVKKYTDVRKLLENKEIDAISIATPHHWHALMTVWACQAGKDVYVEKPVSHELWEGRKMVEASRKYNRIVQAGTQKRSDKGKQELFADLRAGVYGPIKVVRGFCYKPRKSIGKVSGPTPIPDYIDYDIWCGPAPKEPLMRESLHYDWHWVWPTGNGDIGNQGVHEMDLCRWMLGVDKLPERAMSIGGRFGYIDDGNTANTQIAFFDYKPAPIIFEVHGLGRKEGDWSMDHYKGVRIGIVVECEGGYYAGGDGGGWVYDNDGNRIKQYKASGAGSHQNNFIDAVRSRKREDQTADILEGHLSAALCHLGNISYRLGEDGSLEDVMGQMGNNPYYHESFDRFQEHILRNHVNLEETPRHLGPWLQFDPAKEQFVGELADKANPMLRRQYREPFVLPENV